MKHGFAQKLKLSHKTRQSTKPCYRSRLPVLSLVEGRLSVIFWARPKNQLDICIQTCYTLAVIQSRTLFDNSASLGVAETARNDCVPARRRSSCAPASIPGVSVPDAQKGMYNFCASGILRIWRQKR
jgi:hypothetical protein